MKKTMLKASVFIFVLINHAFAQGMDAGSGMSGGSEDIGASGSASGSVSIDCDPVKDGLPSCACLSGSASGSAEGSAGGAEGSASVSVEPGVNCIDDAGVDSPDGPTTYQIDVERNSIMIQGNNWVKLENVVQANANITFNKEINEKDQIRIYTAEITNNGKQVWKWNEDKSMKNACDDSFEEGTVEYIIYDIVNKMMYNEGGCNIPAGTVYIMPPWLYSYKMKFNQPISCGYYSLDMWFKTPEGGFMGRIWFDWKIPEGSNCLPDVEQLPTVE